MQLLSHTASRYVFQNSPRFIAMLSPGTALVCLKRGLVISPFRGGQIMLPQALRTWPEELPVRIVHHSAHITLILPKKVSTYGLTWKLWNNAGLCNPACLRSWQERLALGPLPTIAGAVKGRSPSPPLSPTHGTQPKKNGKPRRPWILV